MIITVGHRSYAKTWRHVSEAAAECELAIILGTDHAGGDCKITPTLTKLRDTVGGAAHGQGVGDIFGGMVGWGVGV